MDPVESVDSLTYVLPNSLARTEPQMDASGWRVVAWIAWIAWIAWAFVDGVDRMNRMNRVDRVDRVDRLDSA